MPRKSLASVTDRFLANFLDSLTLLVVVPAIFLAASLRLERSPTFALVCLALGLASLIQGYYLSIQGQTLGMMMMKIKVVRYDTRRNGGFVTNVLIRLGLGIFLLGMIPFYSMVDYLFVFGDERRCIHDLIAGTCVINA